MVYPVLSSMYLSLFHRIGYDPDIYFVGLENYRSMLADPHLLPVFKQTAVWVLGSVSTQLTLGLVLALVLHSQSKGTGAIKAIILSPWALSGTIVGITWILMLHPEIGVLNPILMRLGILSQRVAFLSQRETAMLSVILANTWRGVPFFAIMLLAGLQAIPVEVTEAASMDGANPLQQFVFISLPFLKPVLSIAVLLRLIWTLGDMDLIWVMTRGGPAFSTQTITSYTFMIAHSKSDFGYGAALSVVLFAVVMLLTWLYLRATSYGKASTYEA
jgi:multiple sugar transport system permease protein